MSQRVPCQAAPLDTCRDPQVARTGTALPGGVLDGDGAISGIAEDQERLSGRFGSRVVRARPRSRVADPGAARAAALGDSVGPQQFAARNRDATGIYNGVFEEHWNDEPLASFAIGSTYYADLIAYTRAEGAGESFAFDSTTIVNPLCVQYAVHSVAPAGPLVLAGAADVAVTTEAARAAWPLP